MRERFLSELALMKRDRKEENRHMTSKRGLSASDQQAKKAEGQNQILDWTVKAKPSHCGKMVESWKLNVKYVKSQRKLNTSPLHFCLVWTVSHHQSRVDGDGMQPGSQNSTSGQRLTTPPGPPPGAAQQQFTQDLVSRQRQKLEKKAQFQRADENPFRNLAGH